MLVSPNHLSVFGTKNADNLLKTFIKHCEFIYGSEFYVYNTHVLCHLAQEAEQFGTLDCFSAFPFENFLGVIKGFIRSPHHPLQQIYRRLSERNFVYLKPEFSTSNLSFGKDNDGPTINLLVVKQYKKMLYKNLTFCISSYSCADAYCMMKNNLVVEIHNICINKNGETIVVGKQFMMYKPLYTYPIDSRDLSIYVVNDLSDLLAWNILDISSKCIVFPNKPDNLSYVSFPLLHTL